MKTEPYDPDRHGDGRSVLVPMSVERPEGANVAYWYAADGHKPVMAMLRLATHWSIAPTTPEPEKCYAEYLVSGGEAFAPHKNWNDKVTIYDIREDPKRARALIDFIQDTLAEQEEGE